jgi:hypothetical protein
VFDNKTVSVIFRFEIVGIVVSTMKLSQLEAVEVFQSLSFATTEKL